MATRLGDAAVGTTVKIKVDGTPREFIILHQGLPSTLYDASCNGTWLLMKDCYTQQYWNNSNLNAYGPSTINSYLNTTFFNLIAANIRAQIKQAKIPYRPGSGTSQSVNSGANGLSAKIFLLSDREVGYTQSNVNSYIVNDGAKLSYFQDGNGTTEKIAKLNGSASSWWLRSPCTRVSTDAWGVLYNGGANSRSCSYSYGVRPAFILPPDLYISDSGEVVTNSPPTAPESLTVPSVTAGDPVAISWTAATDPDGTIAAYHLERSANMGVWEEIYAGPGLTYTDAIGADWGTVAYRVCAEDNQGALGPYATSETQEVQAGVLYIAGPSTAIGMVTEVTTFRVNVGVSGHTEIIPDISMTLELDGAVLFEGVVVTGYDLTFPLDPRILGGGAHTITGTAEKQGYVTANQTYTFYTAVLKFPDGGLGTLIQDEQAGQCH